MTTQRRENLPALFNELIRDCRITNNTEAERMVTQLYESIEKELSYIDSVKSILDRLQGLGEQAGRYL